MKTADLKADATTDALVALAQDWKIMRVEGNEGRVIISKTGKTIDYLYKGHTCIEMLNSGKTLYSPTQGNQQTYDLIGIFNLTVGRAHDDYSFAEWGMYSHQRYTEQELALAICKAVIASVWGDTIPDDVMGKVG